MRTEKISIFVQYASIELTTVLGYRKHLINTGRLDGWMISIAICHSREIQKTKLGGNRGMSSIFRGRSSSPFPAETG